MMMYRDIHSGAEYLFINFHRENPGQPGWVKFIYRASGKTDRWPSDTFFNRTVTAGNADYPEAA